MKSDLEKEAGNIILKEYGEFFKEQYVDLSTRDNFHQNSNKTYLPIKVHIENNELLPVIELVASDNTMMTKVLGVLSSLCVEITKLKGEAFEKHIPFLAVYEEFSESEISLQIDAICDLNAFLCRCEEVLKNICSQVIAIYTEAVVNLYDIQLHYIINHMGELFTTIIILELLISSTTLSGKWNKYINDINIICAYPEYSTTKDRVNSLSMVLDNIKNKIMMDNIVQNCLNSLAVLRSKLVHKNCSILTNEFQNYLKKGIGNLELFVQGNPTYINMFRCIKINSLFLLGSHLFGISDKKIFKSLLELNVKAHSIPIAGTVMWFPEQFLQRYMATLLSSQPKVLQNMLKARQNYLSNKKNTLIKDINTLDQTATQWILNSEKYFTPSYTHLNTTQMSVHTKTLLKGIDIVSHIHFTMLTFINLHLSLGLPLSKSNLMSIFHTVDITKSIRNVINRNNLNIIRSINMIIHHLQYQIICAINDVKKTMMTDQNYANDKLDEITCLVLAEKALKGAATRERLISANIALSFLPNSTYTEEMYTRIGMLMEKIQSLLAFTHSIELYSNCSWMLWHQNILPIYLEQDFVCQMNVYKLRNFFSSMEDCIIYLRETEIKFGVNKSEEFLAKIIKYFENNIVNNASHQVETNLRLHIHSHLDLDLVNPFSIDMMKRMIFTINRFRILETYLTVVPSVEHYLSTVYYNLTTVVLSDWKTYGEMRQMARFKFQLDTVKDNLPKQTLEQGLDVLEIMRDIHVFVSKYMYNLNNQIFIEKSSSNRHLNLINIKHVANSIRTHGTGVMNTTVNFTFQFLKKKFYTFSQFLYDEHIKSRLVKDMRILKENATENSNMYPYKNAERFNKAIKVLGVMEDGQSYLDLFRDLISQIGNAMGYVRMIRSGGRHCCADATVFLPSVENVTSFKDLSEQSGLNPTTVQSAEVLDQNIDNLVCNLMHGTEYFKLLVDVFSHIFRNPKNVHLRNFYMIVPPLTVNFVEHMILVKDKMNKKKREGAAFTDDGFAMGVAYILKLLDQDANFESLHWFNSIWKHIKQERLKIDEQKSKGSTHLQLALALSEKKLQVLEREYNLLYFSLSSARIFFR